MSDAIVLGQPQISVNIVNVMIEPIFVRIPRALSLFILRVDKHYKVFPNWA